MSSLTQTTEQSLTTSGAKEDPSCCIIQIENPPNSPKRLKNSAGSQACCIFRVPHTLVQANEAAYKPKIVSIGPYHYSDGKDHLQMIQEHKQRYLGIFLSKTNKKGVFLTHLLEKISSLEERIRGSYSEDLKIDGENLTNMMVLDGCFILTLFLVVSKTSNWKKYCSDDPILMLRWILPALRSDLLLLENQVPLFLLQNLLETSKLFSSTNLNQFIFEFFGFSIKRSKEFWKEKENLDANHLLDLIRKTFIPNQPQHHQPKTRFSILSLLRKSKVQVATQTQTQKETPRPNLHLIASAKTLRQGGIKFHLKEKYDTPLDITLEKGVLKIPKLTFDDFFSTLLINCLAFEQFNIKCTTEMTSYVSFMGCLINTEADATFLSEKNIIENYFGTGEQVTLFFKNSGKDIFFNIKKSYLANVFEGVNIYTSKGYHVQWAGFKYTHFNSSWAILSSCAALILLLLTIFQAFFAAYPYFYSSK